MTDAQKTEDALLADLEGLGDRLLDEEFCTELYRALAGGHMTKDGASVAPSWGRAEALVNRLRDGRDLDELTLAQTGGEGELSDLVATELERLGWSWRPRDVSRDDPAHVSQPSGRGSAEASERNAPVSDSDEWQRQAHAEADATRAGSSGAPAESGPGEGAGGGEAPRVGGS
ncbi:MAG: hypothetical protein M3P40_03240 [Actinomycetota bacterium]|nr:hypothetical protein [Actinomycetota bacterium]